MAAIRLIKTTEYGAAPTFSDYHRGHFALTTNGGVVTEETWHQARLIPTSGINGAEEQERRATSALLAVFAAVDEFGRALLKDVGAPAGRAETFIEVPFLLGDARVIPDGLIRVRRGSREWTALVEVKTGKNELRTDQLEHYLDVAREQGFDAVVTVSNEISPDAGTTSDEGRQKKASKGRTSPLVVVVHRRDRGDAEVAPRSFRSGAGVDSRRTDPIPRAPAIRGTGVR
ncbi:hypothetical protein [Mumia quercus]|uniref:hypothetical protein n=1 Tax=Mumia quercus TaxID=2976125 RepID=UPI0021CF752F|nr:hypothetical protein [Mumia quercus]